MSWNVVAGVLGPGCGLDGMSLSVLEKPWQLLLSLSASNPKASSQLEADVSLGSMKMAASSHTRAMLATAGTSS